MCLRRLQHGRRKNDGRTHRPTDWRTVETVFSKRSLTLDGEEAGDIDDNDVAGDAGDGEGIIARRQQPGEEGLESNA